MGPTFGEYLREKRLAAGISLRKLADDLEITHVYLGEVERGKRRTLPESYWPDLVRRVPGISEAGLRAAADISAKVTIDPADHQGEVRDLAIVLARKLATGDVSNDKARKMLRILQGEGDR